MCVIERKLTLLHELNKEPKTVAPRRLGLNFHGKIYVHDVLRRFKRHAPANANSAELHTYPKIQLYSGGTTKVMFKK